MNTENKNKVIVSYVNEDKNDPKGSATLTVMGTGKDIIEGLSQLIIHASKTTGFHPTQILKKVSEEILIDKLAEMMSEVMKNNPYENNPPLFMRNDHTKKPNFMESMKGDDNSMEELLKKLMNE